MDNATAAHTKYNLFTLLAACLLSVAANAQQGGPPATPVNAEAVRSEKLVVEINATGTLVANESLTLRPEIVGRIDQIKFKEGDRVKKGDILVTLDAAEYRARLEVSEADLKLKQINFDRSKRLFQQKLTSSQEYDQDAALLEQAIATRTLNQEILRKTVLRAPFNGILGLRKVSPGDYVKDGADIVDIADVSMLKVDFQIPETAFRELKIGQKLTLQLDSYPDETFTGEVYAIAPKLDTISRSLQLRARVLNPDERLRPGMFARVKLHIAEKDNALMVPEEALWPIGNKQFVYRVVDGKALLTEVTTGYRRSGAVEITDGLKADELVITAGQMKIRDGAPVMVINTPQTQAKD